MPETKDAIDRLYAAPLEGFVAARDEIVKELRASGDADGAASVKRIRKPSVPAWAVNQLARQSPERLDHLFEIGDRLGDAQRAVLRGEKPAALHAATAEERAAVAGLVEEAVAILLEGGHAATQAYRERIAETLFATASDAAARETVRLGRLDKEVQRVGFGPAGPDLSVIAGTGEPDRGEDAGERRERVRLERARARVARLEAEAVEAEDRADTAEREARDREREAAVARTHADRARARADRARAAAREAAVEPGESS